MGYRATTFVLTDAKGVREFRRSLPYSRPKGRVCLAGTSLQDDERQQWEVRLSRYYPACGCGFGATLTLLALLTGMVSILFQWWTVGAFPGTTLALVVLGTIAAAIVGKVLGLLLGRLRMSWALYLLELRLDPAQNASPDRPRVSRTLDG